SAIGALQMELGRYEDAAKNYREVLHREPANATSIHNLEICEEKIEQSKKPSPALVKAIVLHVEKKTAEAIEELERAIRSGAAALDVIAALGHLQFEVGRFDAAAEAYHQALAREPRHKTCHYNLAVCLE